MSAAGSCSWTTPFSTKPTSSGWRSISPGDADDEAVLHEQRLHRGAHDADDVHREVGRRSPRLHLGRVRREVDGVADVDPLRPGERVGHDSLVVSRRVPHAAVHDDWGVDVLAPVVDGVNRRPSGSLLEIAEHEAPTTATPVTSGRALERRPVGVVRADLAAGTRRRRTRSVRSRSRSRAVPVRSAPDRTPGRGRR